MLLFVLIAVSVAGPFAGLALSNALHKRWPRNPWGQLRAQLREAWSRRFGEYARLERAALPDGTRVRLVCGPGCGFRHHEGVWTTSWTPRRLNDIGAPDDYKLVRETDGETTFAHRSAIEPVP